MKTNQILDKEKNITPSEIEKLESEIGLNIPDGLKTHLLNHNGGVPEKYIFSKNGVFYVVNELLSVKYGTNLILDNFEDIKDLLPTGYIPFAVDPSGNYFCCNEKDEIFYWNQEDYESENDAITFLAPNVSEFISNMEEDEE